MCYYQHVWFGQEFMHGCPSWQNHHHCSQLQTSIKSTMAWPPHDRVHIHSLSFSIIIRTCSCHMIIVVMYFLVKWDRDSRHQRETESVVGHNWSSARFFFFQNGERSRQSISNLHDWNAKDCYFARAFTFSLKGKLTQVLKPAAVPFAMGDIKKGYLYTCYIRVFDFMLLDVKHTAQ